MAAATTWIILVTLAFGLLYAMHYTGDFLDAVFVRLAAIMFLGAGFVGAGGWFGSFLQTVFTTTNSVGDQVARSTAGTAIMFMLWFLLGVFWLLCILPEKWFARAIPDWLSLGGLVIPAGLTTVPGPAGDALRGTMETIANVIIGPVQAMFGG